MKRIFHAVVVIVAALIVLSPAYTAAAWWVFFRVGPGWSVYLTIALVAAWTVGYVVQDVALGRWTA